MATVDEAGAAKQQLAADIKAGVDTLSQNQEITFTKYVRLVLPLDGFVFWVRADLVSASALYSAARFNAATYNEAPRIITPAATLTVEGSLHYETLDEQNEDESIAINRVTFTAEQEVNDFNQIGPNVMFVGTFEDLKFAFAQRASFYQQADTFHYVGNAVYPAMETQLVDSVAGLDFGNVVVSDSLPIWLALNGYLNPVVPEPSPVGVYGIGEGPVGGGGDPQSSSVGGFVIGGSPVGGGYLSPFADRFLPITLPLYPSYAVPQNLAPPYASVHIVPDSTEAIQAAPYLDATLTHWQLVSERVRITIYGLRNYNALSLVDAINQYSLDSDLFGIMNMPTLRDEKRTQVEIGVLAMKKSIEFKINYYQTTARQLARQLIVSCIPTFYLGDEPLAVDAMSV